MSDQQRVRELLVQAIETNRTPEEVCADDPQLLAEVRALWERMQLVGQQVDALFPEDEATNLEPARLKARQRRPSDGEDARADRGRAEGGPPRTGSSVLKDLEAAAPGSVRPVNLRPPADAPPTPVNLPDSAEMPQPDDLPERYQLVGEIARGGMGAVFKGRDADLGRDIAVKVMLEHHRGRPDMLQRFVEEAQIGGQLQHPGVVPVYELNQTSDRRLYFTMKLVKGKTLSALLDERTACPQPRPADSVQAPPVAADDLPRFLGVFEQVCQTVAYAHARGVIHRDLKPGNVMVGNFGEVQVMDWGLAKVLAQPDEPGRRRERPEEVTVIRTARSDSSKTGGPARVKPGSQTLTGSVLGTPAYMAPEQARGEIEQLDERCDVFSLGAMLCQILTGRPPYTGSDVSDLCARARRADLDEAWRRLDGCGADTALVALARCCLQPRKEDRPRDAGRVAQAITGYFESVQARLKQAELERAAAEARAEEELKRRQVEQGKARAERQRRRLAVALAAVLVILATGAALGGWWYQQEQLAQAEKQRDRDAAEAQRQAADAARKAEEATRKDYLRKEVGAALDQGERELRELQQGLQTLLPTPDRPLTVSLLLSDLKQWEGRVQKAKAFWQRAQALARTSPGLLPPEQLARLERLGKEVAVAEADFDLARRLDAVRLEAGALAEGKLLPLAAAAPKYENLFREKLNLDLRQGPVDALAEQIKASALRYALTAALDFWADVTREAALALRLLAVARQADPDPWRDQVRDARIWQDRPRLKQLATDVQPKQQTPQVLLLLAQRLRGNGDPQAAADLLRTALVHHPADFWLNVQLTFVCDDAGEKVGCYRAALAVRPDSAPVHANLGTILQGRGDLPGARACYEKALELHPRFPQAHNNLGTLLNELGDLEGAVACYEKALALDPTFAGAHVNLGNALFLRKDIKGAIACYETALECDSAFAPAHYSLGRVLFAVKNLDGAIPCFQKALEIDPNHVPALYNLGAALAIRGNPDEAIALFKKALAIDPKHVLAHYGLGNALREKQDLDGAIASYKKALDLDPRYTRAHVNLGTALAAKGDVQGAIASYRQALAQDGSLAWVHCNLGRLLIGEDQLAAALEELEIGHKLGTQQADWSHPSGRWVQQCKVLLALDQKWAAIQKGDAQPGGPSERLALAGLCQGCKKQFVAAARLYAEAFAAAPKLAADLAKAHRYYAACAAALAAAGGGKDAADLDADARSRLRSQALVWLQADLEVWRKQGAGGQRAAVAAVIKTLSGLQSDPQLASVRDEKALVALPEAERKQWQSFWREVALGLEQANQRLSLLRSQGRRMGN
jgi:serine/threonine protein kinase/Flp pilus assembly protein TadD